MKKVLLFVSLIVVLLFGCSFPKEEILFFGHTYRWGEIGKLDERIDTIDISKASLVLLGGDMLGETVRKSHHLNYLKEHFRIDTATTLWSVGNHDTRGGNPDLIRWATGRPLDYVYQHKTICIQVFNANYQSHQKTGFDHSCEQMERQLNTLRSIADTIDESSHFILLTHLAFWGDLDTSLYTKSNYDNSMRMDFDCTDIGDGNSTYKYTLWPELKRIQEKGTQVIVLSGDFGQKVKKYEWEDEAGIHYLGAGVNNSILKHPKDLKKYEYVKDTGPEYLLKFDYTPIFHRLRWHFEPLIDYQTFIDQK